MRGGVGYVSASRVDVPGTPGNSGSGAFGATSVIDAGDPDYGIDRVISFPSSGTYQADTVPASATAIASGSYTSGGTITFGGLQISISGTPAAADTFNVLTAKNAGTDVFAAINDVIKALKTPMDNGGSQAQAKMLNALSTANRKITNAHDNVLTVRASVGTRLEELDAMSVNGDSRMLSDKSYLSDLQDLDYASAIAEFYQRQTALQASQQTFIKVQHIALFNYL